ncbi:MAG: hypothetical protein RBS72_04335 [Sedimentisphaerales bacterium]|jgi:hypothetical protein|nr:hypothetical protein [Sedimentisphaerales bacterium]HNY77585.1 hypothetical protein [Sedimentisphaerales bacterium]HOC61918.1 hypothetical protein [Sedimentisphaerales bacterium]HOH63760.1 hypothetical protein [Sedimentisphaerales bacterium]HPY48336.1 hypothetical protein [Sedimentisphaerales bacterium]
MSESKRLTKRQRAVIEDLFADQANEREVLDRHNVSAALYDRWLGDERFRQCVEERIARAYRQARLILARNAPQAAQKLIELTGCPKEDLARRACLDIIAPPADARPKEAPPANAASDPAAELPPETATRLLAALANTGDEDAD